MPTISEKDMKDIMSDFFASSKQVIYDESYRIYDNVYEKDSNGKNIIIKNVPHLTYIEGDLDDSFIPGDVERALLKFLKAIKSGSILYSLNENDELVVNYNDVELYSKQ
ncbi:hypothetical protein [Exiguobacterium undae]